MCMVKTKRTRSTSGVMGIVCSSWRLALGAQHRLEKGVLGCYKVRFGKGSSQSTCFFIRNKALLTAGYSPGHPVNGDLTLGCESFPVESLKIDWSFKENWSWMS